MYLKNRSSLASLALEIHSKFFREAHQAPGRPTRRCAGLQQAFSRPQPGGNTCCPCPEALARLAPEPGTKLLAFLRQPLLKASRTLASLTLPQKQGSDTSPLKDA